MQADRVPWDDLEALRELAESHALDPLQGRVKASDLETARLVNERILGFCPGDYLPALRISRVHLAWSKAASRPDLADHHRRQRETWLVEALLRDPPPGQRRAISGALGTRGQRVPGARARSSQAIRALEMTTLPLELTRLARSLREDEPRLPHLGCVASHRAVAYADRGSSGEADPDVASERFVARSSLAASLRAVKRAGDAVIYAKQAVGLRPDHPVGWTTLIGATRDNAGPSAAVGVVEDALQAVGEERCELDARFALAAHTAYERSGQAAEARRWLRLALTAERSEHPDRQYVLSHAERLVGTLRSRGLTAEALELESLVRAAAA